MRRALGIFALVFVVLVVVSCGASCAATVPPFVREEMAKAPRGTATIVFFTDFECPFCRRTHAALAPILAARKEHVRLVLRHVPLARHPWARGAAHAAICVEALGGDRAAGPYADALFVADDLSPAGCQEIAARFGLDRDAMRACMSSAETDARVERDTAAFASTGGEGVPLLFIGAARFEGAQPPETLEAAVDDAIAAAR